MEKEYNKDDIEKFLFMSAIMTEFVADNVDDANMYLAAIGAMTDRWCERNNVSEEDQVKMFEKLLDAAREFHGHA